MREWKNGTFDRGQVPKSIRKFAPAQAVPGLASISLDELKAAGKTLILLDVDNTLVRWKTEDCPPGILDWLAKAKEMGFNLCLLSNTKNPTRLGRISELLGIPVVRGRFKPSRAMYRLALIKFQTKPENAVMVGDQMMTDVLGANRSGIDAIWVQRMEGPEFAGTKVNRAIEGMLSTQVYKTLVLPEDSPKQPAATPLQTQIIRFLIVGGSSFAIDYALTALFMKIIHIGDQPMGDVVGNWLLGQGGLVKWYADVPDKAAAPLLGGLASFIAMFNSYFWNRLWTFEAKGKDSRLKQIQRFYAVAITGALLNALLFSTFYSWLHGGTIIVPKMLAAGLVAIWNFTGMKVFAFRSHKA
jgi:HAD superfamily phosphatase (TIGR01668 family)